MTLFCSSKRLQLYLHKMVTLVIKDSYMSSSDIPATTRQWPDEWEFYPERLLRLDRRPGEGGTTRRRKIVVMLPDVML
jgi:hypothetical protein